MVLRRPVLMTCIATIVLGCHLDSVYKGQGRREEGMLRHKHLLPVLLRAPDRQKGSRLMTRLSPSLNAWKRSSSSVRLVATSGSSSLEQMSASICRPEIPEGGETWVGQSSNKEMAAFSCKPEERQVSLGCSQRLSWSATTASCCETDDQEKIRRLVEAETSGQDVYGPERVCPEVSSSLKQAVVSRKNRPENARCTWAPHSTISSRSLRVRVAREGFNYRDTCRADVPERCPHDAHSSNDTDTAPGNCTTEEYKRYQQGLLNIAETASSVYSPDVLRRNTRDQQSMNRTSLACEVLRMCDYTKRRNKSSTRDNNTTIQSLLTVLKKILSANQPNESGQCNQAATGKSLGPHYLLEIPTEVPEACEAPDHHEETCSLSDLIHESRNIRLLEDEVIDMTHNDHGSSDSSEVRESNTSSLVSMCITVAFFCNKELRKAVLPVIKSMASIQDPRELIQAAVRGINGKGIIENETGTFETGLQTTSSLGRADLPGPTSDVFFHRDMFNRHANPLVPRSGVSGWVYPASFLPSAGSSPAEAMSHLGSRLASLNNLPASCTLSRVRLAQTGFYYDVSKPIRDVSNAHEVVCYSCGLTHGRWTPGDNPATVHQRLRPDCEHVKTLMADVAAGTSPQSFLQPPATLLHPYNSLSTDGSSMASSGVFMSEGASSTVSAASSLQPQRSLADSGQGSFSSGMAGPGSSRSSHFRHADSVSGRSGAGELQTDCSAIAPSPITSQTSHVHSSSTSRHGNPPPANQSSYPAPRDTGEARAQYTEDRPAVEMGSAVYPQFCGLQQRRATFSTWPLTSLFNPEHLIMLGFYYAGYADCLRCFYCGVGLKSWAAEDDVMREHIRWRPSCGYILNTKGRQFVDSVLASLQPISRGEEGGETRDLITGRAEQNPATTQTRSFRGDPALTSAGTGAPPALHYAPSVAASAPTRSNSSTAPSVAPGSSAPRSNASSPAPSPSTVSTSAASASRSGGSQETLSQVAEMGFSNEVIARAVRQLGANVISVETLVQTIVDLDQDGEGGNVTANQPAQPNGGASAGEPAPHAEEVSRAQRVALENAGLKRKQTCKVCGTQKVGVVYLPCGHVVACAQCGARTRHCSHCGEFIKATANVYLS